MPSPFIYETFSLTVSGIAVAGGGFAWKHRHDSRDRFEALDAKVDTVISALVTATATQLAPSPPPGIIEQTQANTEAVYAMSLRMAQTNGKLARIEGKVDALAGGPPAVTLPEIASEITAHEEVNTARQAEILQAIKGKE